MPFKTNWEKLGIIIIFLIIIINFIFRTDMLALITGPIALIIVMILCQTSVIAEKRSNINQLTHSPNGEKCKGNGFNENIECMCDECEHFLECFPDWKDL